MKALKVQTFHVHTHQFLECSWMQALSSCVCTLVYEYQTLNICYWQYHTLQRVWEGQGNWTQLHRLLTTLISTFLFDLCIYDHHNNVVQTHQELNLNNNIPLLFSTIHTSKVKRQSLFTNHIYSSSIMTISITTNRVKDLRNSGWQGTNGELRPDNSYVSIVTVRYKEQVTCSQRCKNRKWQLISCTMGQSQALAPLLGLATCEHVNVQVKSPHIMNQLCQVLKGITCAPGPHVEWVEWVVM